MRSFFLTLLAAYLLLSTNNTDAQYITTIAGNGVGTGTTAGSYSGDGGPATAAGLGSPAGIFIDTAGSIFVAEIDNSTIRKISHGIITTYAGTHIAGYTGDGGPATAAKFNRCYAVVGDTNGNIWCSDVSNHCIRKIDASGTVTTIAGIGTLGYGGDGGPATMAMLRNPYGLYLDSVGNLFISDQSNGRIRKVDALGDINLIAGNGTASFSGDGGFAFFAGMNLPTAVCIDTAGNMYIADQLNNRIRKVTPGGIISTIAGTGTPAYSGDGGPATAAALWAPTGLALDSMGKLFIADCANGRVRAIDLTTGIITTVAGNGTLSYSGDNGPATAAGLYYPTGITFDKNGVLYIADRFSHRIRKLIPDPATLNTGKIAADQYQVFPVPAKDWLWITNAEPGARVSLLTIWGAQVADAGYTGGKISINTSALAPGSYVLRITDASGYTTSRMVQKR